MEWNDNFKIGVVSVDSQHEELVNLLNKLQTSIKLGDDQKAFANTIRALVDYTNYHFSTEEEFMSSIRYPKLDIHKTIHEKLISDVKNILIGLKQGNPVRAISLMRFLNDWVCKHILEEDLEIGKFIRSQQFKKYPESSNSKPSESLFYQLTARVLSLFKQYENGVLGENEYHVAFANLLDSHFNFAGSEKITAFSGAISFMESLSKKGHVTEDEKKHLNTILLKKAISHKLLACFENSNSIIRFIKNLKDENCITTEDYELFYKECL
jgi:hemerythrin